MRHGIVNVIGNLMGDDYENIMQNILLNAFRVAINGSLTQYNMVDGITDEFEDESGVDTGTSTGEDYNSTDDYYKPINPFPSSEYSVDGDTKALIHFDGTDGQTTYTAETGQTVTFEGTAQLDIAFKKFSSASLLLDGNSDYCTLPDSADWTFGSGNFTIDCWVRFNAISISNQICSQRVDDSNYVRFSLNSTNKLSMEFVDGGVTKGNIIMTNAWSGLATNTWYHIAYVRNSSTPLIFIDGISQALTITAAFDTLPNIAAPLHIGHWIYSTTDYYMDGWIDEFRVSKGIARWTSNFNVPENMTLVSNLTEAEAQPDESRVVIFEEDVDAVTLNTDLKAYVSRDSGANWVQATLSDEGNYASSKRILVGTADLSGQAADKTMKWKIETLNSKDLRIHGTSLLWR